MSSKRNLLSTFEAALEFMGLGMDQFKECAEYARTWLWILAIHWMGTRRKFCFHSIVALTEARGVPVINGLVAFSARAVVLWMCIGRKPAI